MSINIIGQKFKGSDLELIDFIQNDLNSRIKKDYFDYFLKKETAIKVGEAIEINLKKEINELEVLNKTLDSSDVSLFEQQELIKKNNSIDKCISRIIKLNGLIELSKYTDILKGLQDYYQLKDFTTIYDINYLSLKATILIFSFEKSFYTSLSIDNEKRYIDFLLTSGKFIDYSFDFEEVQEESPEKKVIKEKDLNELIDKERVWKNIYKETSEEKNKVVATAFNFEIFTDENINTIENNHTTKELINMIKQNINTTIGEIHG